MEKQGKHALRESLCAMALQPVPLCLASTDGAVRRTGFLEKLKLWGGHFGPPAAGGWPLARPKGFFSFPPWHSGRDPRRDLERGNGMGTVLQIIWPL